MPVRVPGYCIPPSLSLSLSLCCAVVGYVCVGEGVIPPQICHQATRIHTTSGCCYLIRVSVYVLTRAHQSAYYSSVYYLVVVVLDTGY